MKMKYVNEFPTLAGTESIESFLQVIPLSSYIRMFHFLLDVFSDHLYD